MSHGRERGLNFWAAYADMLLMLFLGTTVISVAAMASMKESSIREAAGRDEFEGKVKDLGIQASWTTDADGTAKLNLECSIGQDLAGRLAACLGGPSVVEKSGCGFAIQDRLLFDSGKSELRPEGRQFVDRLANCIVSESRNIIGTDALDTITIEGHSDCVPPPPDPRWNPDLINRYLSQTRADMVYTTIVEVLRSAEGGARISPCERQRLLARISSRAYGPFRPRKGSQCTCGRPPPGAKPTTTAVDLCAQDRRVEILLTGRLSNVSPNWDVPCKSP